MTESPTAVGSEGRKRVLIRVLSLGISGALLYLLYQSLDLRGVGQALRQARIGWLAVAIGTLVPIVVLRSLRFLWLMPAGAVNGLAEAVRITLVASAFNVFLPAKVGDFSKTVIVARRGGATVGVSAAVVVYERLSDLLGLIIWCLAGFLLVRPVAPVLPSATWVVLGAVGVACAVAVLSEGAADSGMAALSRILGSGRLQRLGSLADGWPTLLRQQRGRRLLLALFSVSLWFIQLTQVWLFTVALTVDMPFATGASLFAIALIVGQVPITFGGIGARDVALVLLLAPYMSAEEAAAVGILTASRGLLPPLAALPILRPYLKLMIGEGSSSGRPRGLPRA